MNDSKVDTTGAMKHLPPPLAGLLEVLQKSVDEVHEGTLSPAAGDSIASLVLSAVRVIEFGSSEQRLEQLEDDMKAAGLL